MENSCPHISGFPSAAGAYDGDGRSLPAIAAGSRSASHPTTDVHLQGHSFEVRLLVSSLVESPEMNPRPDRFARHSLKELFVEPPIRT